VIRIEHFHFRARILGLFHQTDASAKSGSEWPRGLEIKIPPRSIRSKQSAENRDKAEIKIAVEGIICDNSRLIIGTSDPKDFELKHIVLHDMGPNTRWKYDAVLTNAVPRGEIHSTGTVGPCQIESVGNSFVGGHYTFGHADLNTINGIGRVLSWTGNFKGQLNRIVVDRTTGDLSTGCQGKTAKLKLHDRRRRGQHQRSGSHDRFGR
jgi:hypothetical protein